MSEANSEAAVTLSCDADCMAVYGVYGTLLKVAAYHLGNLERTQSRPIGTSQDKVRL